MPECSRAARVCVLALAAVSMANASISQQSEEGQGVLPALSPLVGLHLDEHGRDADGQCARDTRVLASAAGNRTLWAVRMLDASARVSSGVLWGSRYQLGSYDGCMSVGASSPVGARYCLVSVSHRADAAPQDAGNWEVVEDLPPHHDVSPVLRGEGMFPGSLPLGDIRMGLCVPRSCAAPSLKAALQSGLDPHLRADVRPEHCQEHVPRPSSPAANFFWALVVTLTAVSVAAPALGWSSWDWSRHVRTLGLPDPLVSGIDLSPVSGIRAVNAMYLVALHRGLHSGRVATSNREYFTSEARSRPDMAVLYRGALGVDTFFFLAGLLLAASTAADRAPSLSRALLNRVLRVVPVYAMVLLFHCTALPDMGSGPLWVEVAKPMSDSCRRWWWSNLLFLNNYVNGGTAEPLCMEHSWSLAVDMHMFIAGVLLLARVPAGARGAAALGALALMSTVPLAATTLLAGWPGTVPWTLRTMQGMWAEPLIHQAYLPTHMRAAPYLLGLAAGRALPVLKDSGYRPGRAVTLLATVGSLAVMAAVMCFSTLFNDLRASHSALSAALCAGLTPFVWASALGALIVVTVLGEPTAVRSFLSWQPLVTLSRLTFAVYLVSYPLQALITAGGRDAMRVTPLTIARDGLSDNVISFIISFWLFVVLEAPVRSMAKKALASVPLFAPQPSSYMLYVSTHQSWDNDFTNQVILLRKRANWNANAAFLILLLGNEIKQEDVDFIFSELWRHLVANAAVIVSQPEVDILEWFPISRPDERPVVVARWRHGRLHLSHPLFDPQVIVGQLENYTLKAGLFDWPPYSVLTNDSDRSVQTGIEVELLRAISGAVGFRLHEEVIPEEENWPQLMRRLNEGSIDVALGGFIPYAERYVWFDASASYIQDATRWFVTPPTPLTVLECVFHVFRPQVWMLLFAIYIVIITFEVLLARSQDLDLAQYQRWPAVALDTWRLLVDSSLHALPVTTRVRLLVVAWVIGSMHINQAFRSALTSSLSKEKYGPSPRTLEELVTTPSALDQPCGAGSGASEFTNPKESSAIEVVVVAVQAWENSFRSRSSYELASTRKMSPTTVLTTAPPIVNEVPRLKLP
ncbi:Nose resistant to fluoxetine protein 6 [Frankliniella fusca]|uniref:Nose resistant to fluoxetine protein 6 n=1 Tax=Frankliniella fusca TaxID=407009 RepID=A0AAE1H855_9NEOP|nr:Nose resistant to fluoxetine protein 6 [Frankliniella fusca]